MPSNKQQPGENGPPRGPKAIPFADASVVRREDGLLAIGLADDAPSPLESRAFAEELLARDLERRR
jgi:hypothetical protein